MSGNGNSKQSWFDSERDDDDDNRRDSSSSSSTSNYRIPRPVQRHLARVYGTLTGVSASAVVGSVTYTTFFAPANTGMASFLGVLLFLGVMMTRGQSHVPRYQYMRLGALMLFGLVQGFSLGPMVHYATILNSAIVPQALVSALLIFGSFSASALTAQRRAWLSIGGFLASALSIMFWMQLANFFFRSSTMFTLDLYAGLLVFAGFVAYDTQMIVERADLGDRDFVSHGADLFMNLVNLVVRLLALLSKRENDRRGNDGESSSGRRRKR